MAIFIPATKCIYRESVQSEVKDKLGLDMMSFECEWKDIKWTEKSGSCAPIHCHHESGECCYLVPFSKGNAEISAIAVHIVVK